MTQFLNIMLCGFTLIPLLKEASRSHNADRTQLVLQFAAFALAVTLPLWMKPL